MRARVCTQRMSCGGVVERVRPYVVAVGSYGQVTLICSVFTSTASELDTELCIDQSYSLTMEQYGSVSWACDY